MMNTEQIRFKRFSGHLASLLIAGVVSLFSTPALAETNNVIDGPPSFTQWPTTWVALNELNETSNTVEGVATYIDFVGDTNNPCGFYASTNDYVFFRQRIQANTTDDTKLNNAFFVIVNLIGTNYGNTAAENNYPDYSFTWDSVNKASVTNHGLEMQVIQAKNTQWSSIDFMDIDGSGNSDKKGEQDINWRGPPARLTDGYLRVINEQSTTNFGLTTFIDFAVKWSYLQTHTGLNSNQTWKVTFASLTAGKNDHVFLDGDIAGGADLTSNPTSTTIGWATVVTTPTGLAIPPQGTFFGFE